MKDLQSPKKIDPRKLKEVIYKDNIYSYTERYKGCDGEYLYLLELKPGQQFWVKATPTH